MHRYLVINHVTYHFSMYLEQSLKRKPAFVYKFSLVNQSSQPIRAFGSYVLTAQNCFHPANPDAQQLTF